MKSYFSRNLGQLVFTGAMLGLALSLAWSWPMQWEIGRVRTPTVIAPGSGAVYRPAAEEAKEEIMETWTAPTGTKGGVFDLFTPPPIHYDKAAHLFVIGPADPAADSPQPFDFELLGIKQELYPLQLGGWFAGPDGMVVVFERPGASGSLLARQGDRFADLGLTLASFAVAKVTVEHDDGRPVYEMAGRAELRDEAGGVAVVLESRKRKFSDTPVAVLRLRTVERRILEKKEGDVFEVGESSYRLDHIQREPAQVVVERQPADGGSTEIRTLAAVSSEAKLGVVASTTGEATARGLPVALGGSRK